MRSMFKKTMEFHKHDVGQIQQWIKTLLCSLFMFDDPLSLFFSKSNMFYNIVQSLIEAHFITLLFFFWLLQLHSIAQQDSLISIGPSQFYVPKMVVCFMLCVYLVAMRLFVYIQYAQDPFFETSYAARVDVLYKYLSAFGIISMTLYLLYFLMIFYRAI